MRAAQLSLPSRPEAIVQARMSVARSRHRRPVRCVAAFYAEPKEALAVAGVLRREFGLNEDQLTVIQPDGLNRTAFRRAAQRWRQRWEVPTVQATLSRVALGVVIGLVTGGLAALAAGFFLGTPDAGAHAAAWMQPGLWAGAFAGAVAALVKPDAQTRHRFDEAVVRKLRQRHGVVVAHGLPASEQAPVLAYLQDTSHSWCAEAMQRRHRL